MSLQIQSIKMRGWEVESEIDTKTSFRVGDLPVKITEEME